MIRSLLAGLLALAALAGGAQAATTTTYYHNDLAGSPIAATNENGQVIWRESYRPYGERLTQSAAASGNKIWFTSRRQDAETGLVYMGARYYDPVVGRFMSTDAVQFVEANLHSFNRYAYANNNPYKYVDPDGNQAIPALPPRIVTNGMAVGALGKPSETQRLRALEGFAAQSGSFSTGPLTIPEDVNFALGGFSGLVANHLSNLIFNWSGLKDGDSLPTGKALDAATEHLGAGYRETSPGIFVSADGERRVRMTDRDLAKDNNHAPGGPHLNFESGRTRTKPNGKSSFEVHENKHIYLPQER